MRLVITDWYAATARDLPWRRPEATPWHVLVSEFMLQQTPVARVLPVYDEWVRRWPTPAALAAEPSGEAIRAWGRLGYPRRAQRLHATACALVADFNGEVPSSYDELVSLPGVGGYTARAVRAFGFGHVDVPLDTNVRRVLARAHAGLGDATGSSPTRTEQAQADAFAEGAAGIGAALMELGAVICTARAPQCARCPVAAHCRWVAAGAPAVAARPRQAYAGTDRQARGALLAVLRDADGAVPAAALEAAWQWPEQRERALAGLVADGLAVVAPGGYTLPG